MQRLISYILLFSILLPTLSPWGTIAYFELNREYIAKVLCENRKRPELHCDGKCFLAKKLKQQQEAQDQETSEKVRNTPVIQLFAPDHFTYLFENNPAAFGEPVTFFYQLHIYSAPSARLLRPPKNWIQES